MNEPLNHPEHERLQAFVEESLDEGTAATVGGHVAACPRCRVEVEDLRSLFGALSTLAYHAPATGFADRVMARVRVRQPWSARVEAWLARLEPKTTRGWAVTSAMVALPVLATATLVWWLLSRPGVTAQGLWVLTTEFAAQTTAGAWAWLWPRIAESTLAGWAAAAMDVAASVGRGGIGLGLIMFATLTAASIWILYENLFRTEARRTDYASFVF